MENQASLLQISSPMAEARNHRDHTLNSWGTLRSYFSCKHHQTAIAIRRKKVLKQIGFSVSLCNPRESSRVMQRPEPKSPDACNASSRSLKAPPSNELISTGALPISSFSSSKPSTAVTSSSSSLGGSVGGIHLRRLSGCYACRLVADPAVGGVSRDSSLRKPTLFSCSQCEEIFTNADSLEFHQYVRHAVSELAAEEPGRKIVEIIFQSSWLKKHNPICNIERILKVNNTKNTIARFEEYRHCIISKANKLPKKQPRCVADGNELLRFHCTTFNCSLGLINGSTNLCNSIQHCNMCSLIRDGFKSDGLGRICTFSTSGRAHDMARVTPEIEGELRAMLVCRVIAGRVRKNCEAVEECDSVAGAAGNYSNLDELFVLDPRAILCCFVVIYRSF